ncbi:MAG TPA: AraC family transcriptional regulator [Pseudonocardia sp.]|jgi:AraC-like DNA-binding protein|uniref:AraC family transcriptional regulator n=1 Tax=Pseudonocardia sp. TaxID=60912 RepID=UPI002B4AD66F|nr:AraC family transcriptional regulator [Pseudonocardia sp.]HLU57013.1 AraC family transcriptional regulator [Pseudonocardia sp.]
MPPAEQGYVERLPVPALADVVSTVWVQRVAPDAAAYRQRNLPHGGTEIVCTVGGPPRVLGPLTGAHLEVLVPGSTVVGMRLRPGAARALLGVPASELTDLSVPVDALWGRAAAALGDRVGDAGSPERALATFQHGVLARRAAEDDPDPLVTAAVRLLMPGGPGVAALPRLLGASERTLRRRCLAAVGLGPKALHRVLRFQGFLARAQQAMAAGRSPGALADLAVDAGYADQAHLTRECVRLTGATPRSFLAEAADTCACGHDHAASYGPLLAGTFNNAAADAS